MFCISDHLINKMSIILKSFWCWWFLYAPDTIPVWLLLQHYPHCHQFRFQPHLQWKGVHSLSGGPKVREVLLAACGRDVACVVSFLSKAFNLQFLQCGQQISLWSYLAGWIVYGCVKQGVAGSFSALCSHKVTWMFRMLCGMCWWYFHL